MSQGQIPTGLVKLNDKEALDKWSRLMYYESREYTKWKEMCQENRQFYYGQQLSKEESEKLKDRGQYEIVVNKLRKSMRGIVGLMAAALPKYRVVSAKGDDAFDNYITTLSNRMLDWAWQNSGGIHMLQRAVKRSAVDNIAYLYVLYTSDQKVKFELLSYDDVIVDPSSKHPTFNDAEQIIYVRRIALQKAQMIYGVGNDIVTDYQPILTHAMSDLSGSLSDFLKKIYDTSKRYVKVYECYRKVYVRVADGISRPRIMKETLVGYQHAYREILPPEVTDYPIIPIYSEDTENPYKQGEVVFVKDLQQFINKVFGVLLLNAQTMSNPKVFVRETDIPNNEMDNFRDNYAQPGSISVLSQSAEPPMVVPGQPINNAFYQLYVEASHQLELATMPNEALGYNDSTKAHQISALLEMRESVIDSYKDFMSNIELSLAQLGRVTLQYVHAYVKGQQIIKWFGDKGDIQRIEMNRQREIDLDNPEEVEMWRQQAMQEGMPMQEIDQMLLDAEQSDAVDKALTYYENSSNFSNVDVYVIMNSTTQTYETSMLRLMLELGDRGIVFPEDILKYAPIDNKEALMLKHDTVRRQSYELEEMKEQIEELQKTLEKMAGETDQAKKDKLMTEHEARLYKIEVDKRAKSYLDKHLGKMLTRKEIDKLSNELAKALLDTQHELKQIVLEAKMGETEPEQALLGLEQMKQQLDYKGE